MNSCFDFINNPKIKDQNEINESDNSDKIPVSITFLDSNARTVFPQVSLDNVARYKLLGGMNGAEETELAEFTTTNGVTIFLEMGSWNFTLNAYNEQNVLILQGKVLEQNISPTGNNQINFTLYTLKNGFGSIHITINFPNSAGINRVTASGDIVMEEFTVAGNNGEFIYSNPKLASGDYFISFRFFRDDVLRVVVSELVLVRSHFISAKTITVVAADLKPEPNIGVSFTVSNISEWNNAFTAIQADFQNTEFTIIITSDLEIEPQNLTLTGMNDVSITLRGTGTVQLVTNGSMFNIGSGVTFILENDVILRGRNSAEHGEDNSTSVVFVNSGGTFRMKGGTISGNNVFYYDGGGVFVDNFGMFIMDGGNISGNMASSGGGLYMHYGTFIMSNGTISGNTAKAMGGGCVVLGGIFFMSGGTISGNTALDGGGVAAGGTIFTMSDGAIFGNIASNGGGVWATACTDTDGITTIFGTFNMLGGTIFENTTDYYGGGVLIDYCMFTKSGDSIITGWEDDKSIGNVVREWLPDGPVVNEMGHAIYTRGWDNLGVEINKRREKTIDAYRNLFFDGTVKPPNFYDGWE